MKVFMPALIVLFALATGSYGAPLDKKKRAQLDTAIKSNDTIVVATIDSTKMAGFRRSYSGRAASDKGANGARSSGIMVDCTATLVKVLKGDISTKKIVFELELSLNGTDKKRENPFRRGTAYVLVFRRKHVPGKDDTTRLGFDSWGSQNWWPADSPEGKYLVSQMQ